MASDAEIREAEQAIVDRLRCAIRAEAEWVPNTLEVLVRELDALKSPLPSRVEMARRSLEVARCAAIETPAAQHWADALRWVAREMRVTNEAGAIYNMMPGSPSYQSAFEGAQKQLRAWADELEARE